MIEFESLKKTVAENFYGGEKEFRAYMFVDELNRIMKATLIPGASIGMHRHETSSEIIFILSGTGYTICDGVKEDVKAGSCLYCKKGSEHTLVNNGTEDLVFYGVVPQQ